MITRPDGLVFCDVDLWFNFRSYSVLEIDIEHINFGKNKIRDSYFTPGNVSEIVIELIGDDDLFPDDKKQFGNEFCNYYIKIGKYKSQKYKLVFCICSGRPRSIGIITLFRI